MAKIIQIIPYFGVWPEWINLYLYSCGQNPMIDFLFYTDCNTDGLERYGNVKFVSMSFEEYKKFVSERLSIVYAPSSAYKLTDLKPFLGLIHRQEIKDYEWWGFGDIDLVYGNMEMLLGERNLRRYNLITTHNYHIAGHCTFMRNTDKFLNLCKKISNWQNRLSDTEHYGFDEAEWSDLVYPKLKWIRTGYDNIVKKMSNISFNVFLDRVNSILNPKMLFKEFFTTPIPIGNMVWKYDGNKIIDPFDRELPYLHFLFFKKTPWYKTDTYWRDGFYQVDDDIEEREFIHIDSRGIFLSNAK